MREVKALRSQLKDEQSKVLELFEDAQTVREELRKELNQLEKAKHKIAGKRKNGHSNLIEEEHSFNEESDSEKKNKRGKAGKLNMVSRAISRAESMISFEEDSVDEINHKIEELIDEKTRSIVNVITQS